jgi:hypothetical protein
MSPEKAKKGLNAQGQCSFLKLTNYVISLLLQRGIHTGSKKDQNIFGMFSLLGSGAETH